MLRGVLVVAAGYLITATGILAVSWAAATALGVDLGEPTAAYLAVNLLGGAAAGVLGGYTTGRLARTAPGAHVLGLAFLLFALSLPDVVRGAARGQPGWYPAVIAVLAPVSVVLGGMLLAERRSDARDGGAAS